MRNPRHNSAFSHNPSWHEVSQSRIQRRRGLSLRLRLFAYFAVFVCAAMLMTGWFVVQRAELAGRDWGMSVGRAMSGSLALSGAMPVVKNDLAALQRLADEGREDGKIARVRFADAAGRTLVTSERPATEPSAEAALLSKWLGPVEPVAVSRNLYGRSGEQRVVIGRVDVDLDTRPVEAARVEALQMATALAGGILIAGVLLAWLFLRLAMCPLRKMAAAVERVAAGDWDAMIEVRNDDPSVAALTVAFNDLITWIREYRGRIEQANGATAEAIADLEQKIESRTKQLEVANERLSGEIAEKEDFLRAVSHDLNAPLRNIGGMVQMLMLKSKDVLPPDVVERLERIQKNVNVEADLINELLELSRIKTRRQSLDVVDTEAVVWELRGMFENDLKTRHIDVILETSLPALYAERARVRQVFQNLIDNAIKYMGDDRPVREIRVGCHVNVGEAEFYVRDTGMGIHPEDIDKVFCVFRRGRGEAAQKVPGKGVGLASVKSIVETYAGRIWVQSKLGEGTTFRFTINGRFVPAVSGQVPSEVAGERTAAPTLAA